MLPRRVKARPRSSSYGYPENRQPIVSATRARVPR
jgi:hypothetical protein